MDKKKLFPRNAVIEKQLTVALEETLTEAELEEIQGGQAGGILGRLPHQMFMCYGISRPLGFLGGQGGQGGQGQSGNGGQSA